MPQTSFNRGESRDVSPLNVSQRENLKPAKELSKASSEPKKREMTQKVAPKTPSAMPMTQDLTNLQNNRVKMTSKPSSTRQAIG